MIASLNLWLERLCKLVSGLALMLMMGVAFVDSIGRPLSRPLPGGTEYVTFALLIFFFSALPLAVRANAQIRVGLVADFYTGRAARLERRITRVVEAAALVVLAWMILDQALRLNRFGTQSVYFEWPIAPFVFCAAGFSVVTVWFALQSPPSSAHKVD